MANSEVQADIVDLLKRVHHVTYETGWESSHLAGDAAAEIERLRKGRDLLREALDAANRRADDARAKAIEECLAIADDHTPRKHDGTLAAHVTGATIASAIRALQSRE